MFEELKMMGDLIKSGINSFKIGEKMDQLVRQSRQEYEQLLRPADRAYFIKFRKADEKQEQAPDTFSSEEQDALSEAREAAEFAYLASLTGNTALPTDFRNQIAAVLQEYKKSSPEEVFQRAMMRYAKTPEEKAEFQKLLDDARK